jgi:hypothetical protein
VLLGAAALHAWAWAAMFHCRDLFWTQCGDYFSAFALLLTGCFVSAMLLLESFWAGAQPISQTAQLIGS